MKKVLVIAQVLPALNNGGVERGTVEVANFLAHNGHRSIIISAGGIMQQKLSHKVEHINLKVGKKSLSTFLLIKKLRKLFNDMTIDIIHARSRLPAWLCYKAIAKITTNRPKFVTTIHGLYSVKRYSSIMARGDRVIAVSKTAKKYVVDNYRRYLKTEPRLIYRGIDPKEFPYGFEADILWLQKFYHQHHQLVAHKIVLMPGRLTTLKGTKDLLPWLKSHDNDAKLVLTANPEKDFYAAKLYHWFKQNSVENRVHWVGLQSSMKELYSIASVVVSASNRAESFGRTVLEALSVGTPVVAYNQGGVGEILDKIYPQGKVEFANTQQLADKINHTLTNNCHVSEGHPFLVKNMLEHTLALYQEVTNAA